MAKPGPYTFKKFTRYTPPCKKEKKIVKLYVFFFVQILNDFIGEVKLICTLNSKLRAEKIILAMYRFQQVCQQVN